MLCADLIVELKSVSKVYSGSRKSFWSALSPRRGSKREVAALTDISLEVGRGEVLGIVGRNGAGKSTLLQLIARTLSPTSGEVIVRGSVAAILELGAGLDPLESGYANIRALGLLHGVDPDRIDHVVAAAAEFSELGDRLYDEVATYSSGMAMRLAFSALISVEPDVFIVDEALSVGDLPFQLKCFDAFTRLIRGGTSVILVSHDLGAIQALCQRVLYLDRGLFKSIGEPKAVCDLYHKDVTNRPSWSPSDGERVHEHAEELGAQELSEVEEFAARVEGLREGNGEWFLRSVLVNGHVNPVVELDSSVEIEIRYASKVLCSNAVLAFHFVNDRGELVQGSNSLFDGFSLPNEIGTFVTRVSFPLRLRQGQYALLVSLSDFSEPSNPEFFDYIRVASQITIVPDAKGQRWAMTAPICAWELEQSCAKD